MDIKIVNKSDKEAEITIDDVIGWDESSWPAVKKQLTAIANTTSKKIIVNIMSPGGLVSDGLVIHDALKISKAEIETRVYGLTASAATVIAQSGDTRKMSANSLYLIHHAILMTAGNVNAMKMAVDDLEKVDATLTDIYIKKGADPEKVKALMDENNGYGKWIDADEALAVGLIDEIMEPSKAAAVIPTPEMLAKYNLPQIPEEYLTKIQNAMSEKVEGKRSLKEKIMDLFKSEESEPDEKIEPEVKEEPEEVKTEPAEEPEEVVEDTKAEELAAKDTEISDLKAQIEAKEAALATATAELANVRVDLTAAYTKLSMLDAPSTKVKGGAEGQLDGEAEQEVPFGAEIKKITAQINKVVPKRVVTHEKE